MIGIYKITSPTNKVYIGQSIDIIKRWEKDYKKLNCKEQIKIYNSLKKYGWEVHKYELIEECLELELDDKEAFYKQQFIDEFGWEMALFCQIRDGKGGRKSEETKQKISKIHKGKKQSKETLEKRSRIMSGVSKPKGFGDKIRNRKLSQEAKQKISKALKGKKRSEKFKKELSKNRKGKINNKLFKPILQFDKQGNFIKEWSSQTEASRGLKISFGSINHVLSGRNKSTNGFIFKYKN